MKFLSTVYPGFDLTKMSPSYIQDHNNDLHQHGLGHMFMVE